MKRKDKLKRLMAGVFAVLLFVVLFPLQTETVKGSVRSYDNAQKFFESTGTEKENGKHVACYDGKLYFATQAKMANIGGSVVTIMWLPSLVG